MASAFNFFNIDHHSTELFVELGVTSNQNPYLLTN